MAAIGFGLPNDSFTSLMKQVLRVNICACFAVHYLVCLLIAAHLTI